MQLTVGPTQFFWRGEAWRDFYARLADEAPVDRVVLGELVCSKRLPFYQTEIPQAVERLQAAGKQVVLTSLALITLKRERKLMADLADMGLEVEINDLTALAYLPKGTAFSVGPLINTYNEGTAAWMHKRGAARICLPPELPLASVRAIAAASPAPVEVWGWGRLPLAISGRCYHARLHDRTKDNCQFICDADPDGREVETLDGQDFLAVNGVQTLSAACANAAYQVPALRDAGVTSLRLSPQSEGFAELCGDFRALLDGRITAGELSQRALPHAPGGTYCDGFLTGDTGAAWSQAGHESA
ncbi:MAG: U32 family peptidase [Sediminimonas qiaohouensis]|uniref:Ubiquinone biosynthesis protein UbiV n=1 Tax=Sediminimonas qiaohouensis TaxID=552061 RepID=A0A7C9HAL9_9RHOB|nr:U32 family peptidase [Sediminimonas qiaohouensis]MTJ04244.1 U32 family peptidase [Sediminimonas qiaohouensis]